MVGLKSQKMLVFQNLKKISYIYFSKAFSIFFQRQTLISNRKYQRTQQIKKKLTQILNFCSRYLLKMALFSTFFWISRYFAIFWHIRCQILFMLVILPGFKCGEIQAKYKKCYFQLVKVTTSESPKHRVTLAETVKRPQWCTEKLQMTPKHFTGVNHINRKYFGPFWDLLLTHGSLKVTIFSL